MPKHNQELDPISWLEEHLGLCCDAAEAIFMASLWVDAQHATSRFGYAKDNDIPEHLASRMQRPDYVHDLISVLEDEQDLPDDTMDALRLWAQRIQSMMA